MIRRCAIATLLVLAGCASYDPPMQGDHSTARYKLDLQKCQKEASATATRAANASPQSALLAVFQSREPERADIRTCMVSRGYHMPG